MGPGYRYRTSWAPDSKKIAFIDPAMRMWLHDLDKKATTQIGKQLWHYHGSLSDFRFNWSKDSRWIAFTQDRENRNGATALYDTKESKLHVVTSGYYSDEIPVFDQDGKYLYYRSGRQFRPVYCDLDNTWLYPNTQVLVAVPLRKHVPSPLSPRNDDEGEKKDKEEKEKEQDKEKQKPGEQEKKGDESQPPAAKPDGSASKADEKADKKDKDEKGSGPRSCPGLVGKL